MSPGTTADTAPPATHKPFLSARTELTKLLCGALNHCLDAEPQAQAKLKAHQGKRLQLLSATLRDLSFVITEEGMFVPADSSQDKPAELSLSVDVPRAIQLALQGQEAAGAVKIEGDAEFASAVGWLAANLRWEFEADLARHIGEAASHRIGQTLRVMGDALKTTANDTEAMLKRGFEENTAPLVAQTQFVRFKGQLTELRDAAARLEKRLELLERGAGR